MALRRNITTGLLASLICQSVIADTPDASDKALKNEALALTKSFVSQLKPQLKAAMRSGGPVNAIEVCSVQAPLIAKNLSEESGWEVKRVSLKARNPNAKPDTWEAAQLTMFETQLEEGKPPGALIATEKTDTEYRFMKAQIAQGLCLVCHGTELAPAVKDALAKHYPNDMATGYSLGQVRGAISLSKPLKYNGTADSDGVN